MKNLNEFGVREMSQTELKNTDGGILGTMALFLVCLGVGYLVGKSLK